MSSSSSSSEVPAAAAAQHRTPSSTASPPCKPVRSPDLMQPHPRVAPPTSALLGAHRRRYLTAGVNPTSRLLGALDGMDSDGVRRPSGAAGAGHPLESPGQASTSLRLSSADTPAESSTPSLDAVVMDSLVRRFRATENRLDRWRHADARSRAFAAAQRRQRQEARRTAAGGVSGGVDGAAAAVPPRQPAFLLRSLGAQSSVVQAVQSWWSTRWRRRPVAKQQHSATHNSAAAAGHSGGGSVPAKPAASWVGRSGQRWLRALSQSLSLSSDRGRASPVDVVGPAGVVRRASKVQAGSGNDDDEDEDGVGVHGDALIAGSEGHGVATALHPAHRVPRATVVAPDTATADVPSSSSSCDSSSDSSSDSSGDDARDDDQPPAASGADASQVTDDNRFTLSWIRGLGRDGSPSLLPPLPGQGRGGRADDSFRSASRVLARSRARFTRWLRRQRRLQSVKRAMQDERWRRFSPVRQRDGPVEETTAEQQTTVASASGTGASELERIVLQRPPSSWEQSLPLADGSMTGGRTPAEVRAAARAALQRAIASVAAMRSAAEAGKDSTGAAAAAGATQRTGIRCAHTDNGGGDDGGVTSRREKVAAAPSRAEQQTRQHADAVSRLTDSLSALASCRADARRQRRKTSASRSLHQQQEEKEAKSESWVAGLDSDSTHEPRTRRESAAAASILTSSHPSYASHRPLEKTQSSSPSQQQHKENASPAAACASDEAEAFRSLLVDTTHTPRDTAARQIYEAVMREVCVAQVAGEVGSVLAQSSEAAQRALTQWVQRQVLDQLLQTPAQPSRSAATNVSFLGVLDHIRRGVPASMWRLRLDDADRRALASLEERSQSDATAVTLQTAGYTITYRQLASLSPGAWLNDQVINNYLQLLCEDCEGRQQQQLSQVHGIASMGTHFYAKVEAELSQAAPTLRDASLRGGFGGTEGFPPLAASSAVLRWLRRRQHLLKPFHPADPQSVRAVLVPVNIEAQHWALAVLYNDAPGRWVLYDSMSRSDRAQQRGLRILARLAHIWRECQRHFGLATEKAGGVGGGPGEPASLHVAAPYAPSTPSPDARGHGQGSVDDRRAAPAEQVGARDSGRDAGLRAPIDSLQPYGSLAELHRAAKRLRRQEDALLEQREDDGAAAAAARKHPRPEALALSATSLPSSMLTDTEVEWFTDGYAHVPQQRNGNDCGVFVCQAAWCVAQGVAVSFTQTDVTLLRQVIALELLSRRLLRRYPTEHTSSSADV